MLPGSISIRAESPLSMYHYVSFVSPTDRSEKESVISVVVLA